MREPCNKKFSRAHFDRDFCFSNPPREKIVIVSRKRGLLLSEISSILKSKRSFPFGPDFGPRGSNSRLLCARNVVEKSATDVAISWAVSKRRNLVLVAPRGRYMTEHPRHIKKGKRKEEKEEISLARLHVEEFFGPWGPIVSRVHHNRQLGRGVIKVSFNCSLFVLHVGTFCPPEIEPRNSFFLVRTSRCIFCERASELQLDVYTREREREING